MNVLPKAQVPVDTKPAVEELIHDQSKKNLTTFELKEILRKRHHNDMQLVIYIDPVADEENFYECPADNP